MKTLKRKLEEKLLMKKLDMLGAVKTFSKDETGDFAQYALIIVIVVAIAGIVLQAMTGWVTTVMETLTNFGG